MRNRLVATYEVQWWWLFCYKWLWINVKEDKVDNLHNWSADRTTNATVWQSYRSTKFSIFGKKSDKSPVFSIEHSPKNYSKFLKIWRQLIYNFKIVKKNEFQKYYYTWNKNRMKIGSIISLVSLLVICTYCGWLDLFCNSFQLGCTDEF